MGKSWITDLDPDPGANLDICVAIEIKNIGKYV